MDARIKKQWVKDLRDGTRTQGQDCLRNKAGAQCCLDVLMEQAVRAGVIPAPTYHDGEGCYGYPRPLLYDDDSIVEGSETVMEYNSLTDDVIAWAGLDSIDPHVTVTTDDVSGPRTLSACNDNLNLSFLEIADLIEEQL